ncbi:MAG: hypothetical protein ACJART_002417, partial [Maribacter sp.]
KNMAHIYDFDGDGDLDLFGTEGTYPAGFELVWAENDGSGNFTVHTNIPAGTTTHGEPFIAGLAGGNYDASNGGLYQMAITWNGGELGNSEVQMVTVPSDPINGTWTVENIHPTSLGEGLSNGDIDDDGDLDLFQAGNWLRNDIDIDGSWTLFSTGITFPTTFDRNRLADIDRDGDLDGVVGQIGQSQELAWFEAPSDPEQNWIKNTIDPDIDAVLSLEVIDMDFDGDLDVIVGEWRNQYKLFGFENDLCNSGTWIKYEINSGGVANREHHDGTQVTDIDNDGDLDIISMGWTNPVPRIYENTTLSPTNRFPTANAGEDQELSLPTNSIVLLGSGTDPDGGSIVGYQWNQESGPSTASLSGETTSDVTVGSLVAGSYVFRLTVTDDEGDTDFDDVTVTISEQGQDEFWLEAECAVVGSNWIVVNDVAASGGQYLLPPSGNSTTPPTDVNSIVSFNINVLTAGTYKVYGHVSVPSGSDDSFWVRANGGSWVSWNTIPGSSAFSWHQIHRSPVGPDFVTYPLSVGSNTIEFAHREDGAGLDKVYITLNGNTPTGLGSNDPNCNGTFQAKISTTDYGINNAKEQSENLISIFPNPSTIQTQISMSDKNSQISRIYIYDIVGKIVRQLEGSQLKNNGEDYQLDVTGLEEGVYFVKCWFKDNSIPSTKKLLVRK